MPRRKLTHLNSSPNSGKVVGFVEMNNPADKVWKKAVHSLAAQRYYVQAREMHTHKFARDVNDAVASGRSSPEDRESDESGPRSESGRMARSGQERWFFASCTHSTYHDERSRLVLNAGASKSSLPFDRGVAQELDPLTVLGRPPDRFQDYLFNHYLQHVTKRANTCEHPTKRLHLLTGNGSHRVELALANDALLNAVFLSASRSLAQLYTSGPFHEATLRYKDACIRSINLAISEQGQSPTLSTIAAVVALAADSFVFEETFASEQHCNAAAMMIGLRGGPQAFDGEDLLRRMVQWFTLDQPKENNQLWMKLEVLLAEME